MSIEPEFVSSNAVEAVRWDQAAQLERYLDTLAIQAYAWRRAKWRRDYASLRAYAESVAPNREHWRAMLGIWPTGDERVPLEPERHVVAERADHTVYAVTFGTFPNVRSFAHLLVPKRMAAPGPAVICQHGMGGTPHSIAGLVEEDDAYHKFGQWLAERGYVVLAPHCINFIDWRSRLHNKALLVGRTLMGLETWREMRAVDLLETLPEVDSERIGFYGLSQGGKMALWFPPLEPRIRATVISAFYNERTKKQLVASPHYRPFINTREQSYFEPDFLTEFSDYDLASLICPRPVMIEHGQKDSSYYIETAREEFFPLKEIYERLGIGERCEWGEFDGPHEIHGVESFTFLDRWLSDGGPPHRHAAPVEEEETPPPPVFVNDAAIQAVRDDTNGQHDRYLDNLAQQAYDVRADRWQRDYESVEAYGQSVARNRQAWLAMLGGLPPEEEHVPLNPVRHVVAERSDHRVYAVTLDVLPGVQQFGYLLVPNGITEPRAAVVVQHGLNGAVQTVAGLLDQEDAYHRYGQRLAERGYFVFAPHCINNVTRRVRLHNKAIVLGKRLMGLEIWREMKVIDYLQTLPEVDPGRIGFYGLSQGGTMALWLTPLEPRIRAVVVSAYFNERTRKLTRESDHYRAYISNNEHNQFYSGQLLEFSDADLGSLICPRPLFIEQGTEDSAVYYKDAEVEFQRLHAHYAQLGLGERCVWGLFEGKHEIYGKESYPFLDRWLEHTPTA
ncbi:MAG: acetylxylan esterase [Chloroflexota bacterium]|nr:acetylxylan esterase [Chloroflexota bacterium]